MIEITKFTTEYRLIAEDICGKDEVKIFCVTDLNHNSGRSQCLVFATQEQIHYVEGYFDVHGEKSVLGKKNITKDFIITAEDSFDIADISQLKLEELISSLRMIISEKDGNTRAVCFGTFSCRTDMLLFIKYVEKMMAGDELVPLPEDFDKSLFCPKCGRRYPIPTSPVCPNCSGNMSILAKFMVFLKKYKVQTIIMLASYVLAGVIGIIAPYYSSVFYYDKVLTPGTPWYGRLLLVVLIVAGVNLASILVTLFGDIVVARMTSKLVFDLKVTIFDSMKKLSMDFFSAKQSGSLMTQVNRDARSIYWFFVEGISYYVVNIIQIIAVAVIMFAMQPVLAAVCVSVLPFFLWFTTISMRRTKYYHSVQFATHRSFNSKLTGSMSALRVTRSFGMEDREIDAFGKITEDTAGINRKITIYNNIVPPWIKKIMSVATYLVWIVGGYFTMKGKISYGFFTAFISYTGMLTSPLQMLAGMTDSFADCINALKRLFEIYEAKPTVCEKENPETIENLQGKIEFKNVSFSYDKNRKIIDNVSFTVEPGHCLGIVGHSGAGKTTLANLLIRLYDADRGGIYIDGVNVKDLSMKQLRDSISIVSQETYLFTGTVYENIAYGNPDASKEDVIAAATLAGAHDFIVKMDEGYETMIGAGHKNLSGGERQRLSIARAMLKKPKILILDEATASMDTKTERMIQEAIDNLSANRTTIMIAHRLSTLRNADNLIVIENGRLEESGTHTELLEKDGIYRRLYTMQIAAMKNVIE